MGSKCSCLCAKENDNAYNFYPEVMSTTKGDQDIKGKSKSHQNRKDIEPETKDENPPITIEEGLKSTRIYEDEREKLVLQNIKYLIQIQAACKGKVIRMRFESSLRYELDSWSSKLKEHLYNEYFSQQMKSALEMMKNLPFNKEGHKKNDYLSQLSSEQLQRLKLGTTTSKSKVKSIMFGNKTLYNQDLLIKSDSYYSGQIDISLNFNGYGILVVKNKEIYEGNWLDGNFTGYGRKTISDGAVIEGKYFLKLGFFENNFLSLYGEKRTLNGAYYKGQFSFDLKSGKGTEYGKDYEYSGYFLNDKKQGKGEIIFTSKNESYKGDFDNNLLTGKGVYVWGNKDSYEGDFVDGKMHGKGDYKWPEGGRYVGDYVNNLKVGNGAFYWTNGRIYEGEFKGGKPCGKGIISQDGKKYYVEFYDGKVVSRQKIVTKDGLDESYSTETSNA